MGGILIGTTPSITFYDKNVSALIHYWTGTEE